MSLSLFYIFFFFNDTATTEIYTLSLHDALPIYARDDHPGAARCRVQEPRVPHRRDRQDGRGLPRRPGDRKSTRLNSSHSQISYAVFCLKKKKINKDKLNVKNEIRDEVRIIYSMD